MVKKKALKKYLQILKRTLIILLLLKVKNSRKSDQIRNDFWKFVESKWFYI
jgi:hypothetical protein